MGNESLDYMNNKHRTNSIINEKSETNLHNTDTAVQTHCSWLSRSGQTIKCISKLKTYPQSHKSSEKEIYVLLATNPWKQES